MQIVFEYRIVSINCIWNSEPSLEETAKLKLLKTTVMTMKIVSFILKWAGLGGITMKSLWRKWFWYTLSYQVYILLCHLPIKIQNVFFSCHFNRMPGQWNSICSGDVFLKEKLESINKDIFFCSNVPMKDRWKLENGLISSLKKYILF